ncbi:MAG: DUF3616 domain-containing protein [Bacteroidales bacterium]|nr:DUF3616 domain-containing protein [Bacteroidales bacterium]
MKQVGTVWIASVLCMLSACSGMLQQEIDISRYYGMCDASAGVALREDLFVAANDEDNVLRLYRNDQPGNPIRSFDMSSFLASDGKHPEADIEGAAGLGNHIFWITSHGTHRNGKERPSRQQLFATEVHYTQDGTPVITPAGIPYRNLISDLTADPGFEQFGLDEAARRPPTKGGALNIEGLCVTPKGQLLIGLRNPVPNGKALIIPLENPQEVIAGQNARFGNPLLLPLGGLGIRSMEYFAARDEYLILAGSYQGEGDFRLFSWSGEQSDEPVEINGFDAGDLNPEALVIYPGVDQNIQILSDDGTVKVNGRDCKDASVHLRNFRSTWFTCP